MLQLEAIRAELAAVPLVALVELVAQVAPVQV
jgi:hypothetical protein